MKNPLWRSVVIVWLVQGLATALSPHAGLYAGYFVAIYLSFGLFFVDHPATWRYDLFFFAVAAGISLVATALFATVCAALP